MCYLVDVSDSSLQLSQNMMFLLHFNAQVTYMMFLRFQKFIEMNFSSHFQQFYQTVDIYVNKMTVSDAISYLLTNCCHDDLLTL